jgi:hypothetical protein
VTVVVMDVLIRGADAIAEGVWQTGRADTQRVLDSVAEVTSVRACSRARSSARWRCCSG